MAYIMDFFAANTLEKVNAAISAKKVQYPAYVFIRSEDGTDTGRLAFVDQNNVLKFIVGEECKTQVCRVDELPPVEAGDVDVLYICDDVVYVFNGNEYVPTYKDHSAELTELATKIEALEAKDIEHEEKHGEYDAKFAELVSEHEALVAKHDEFETKHVEYEARFVEHEEKFEELVAEHDAFRAKHEEFVKEHEEFEAKHAELEDSVEVLEKREDLFVEKEYEITNVPVGTLVDYREKEIRIMCPEGTVFEAQNVGPTGNANMYYMAFKAYAPEGAVGFKEGDRGVIVDEYFDFSGDFAGTDELGRNYSIVWLALASYSNDTWTYFGKNSSTSKYIGWDYVVEWYNEDGVVIASDSIRINLSNENCHSSAVPYYMGKYDAMAEELEALQAKVEELESSTVTFIELE